MAQDLAAEIVAYARIADVIQERQREHKVVEVYSRASGLMLTHSQMTNWTEQQGLQILLDDGWRIERTFPVTAVARFDYGRRGEAGTNTTLTNTAVVGADAAGLLSEL